MERVHNAIAYAPFLELLTSHASGASILMTRHTSNDSKLHTNTMNCYTNANELLSQFSPLYPRPERLGFTRW